MLYRNRQTQLKEQHQTSQTLDTTVIPNKTSPFIQYLKEQAGNHLEDTSNKEDSPPMNTDSKLSKEEYNKCTICSDITKQTEDLEKHFDMVVAALKKHR